MIEISKDPILAYYKITCPSCHSTMKCNHSDLLWDSDGHRYIRCPVCYSQITHDKIKPLRTKS